MNKQEIESIIANAPEGASHVSSNGVYYKNEQSEPMSYVWWVRGEEWVDSTINHLTHSLADLKTILELMERVAELEQSLADAITTINQLQGDYETCKPNGRLYD